MPLFVSLTKLSALERGNKAGQTSLADRFQFIFNASLKEESKQLKNNEKLVESHLQQTLKIGGRKDT